MEKNIFLEAQNDEDLEKITLYITSEGYTEATISQKNKKRHSGWGI